MRYQTLNISIIRPYENNARTHSKEQINKIAASISEYGSQIIVGHGRLEATGEYIAS